MENKKVIAWFEVYKEYSKKLSQKRIADDLNSFNSLLDDYKIVKNRADVAERKLAPDFNIFYILKYILNKEEITHSPFLAHLLDINGKHQQGALFFDELIKQLNIMDNRFLIDDFMFFTVSTEKWIGNGELDIFIEYNSPKNRFALAIENKISAKDQPTQLERYAAYLEREFKGRFLLLYLTPEVSMPEMPFSIKRERFDYLIDNNLLKLITYKNDISLVLRNTIPKIQSEKVSLMVKQYFQVIKNNFA